MTMHDKAGACHFRKCDAPECETEGIGPSATHYRTRRRGLSGALRAAREVISEPVPLWLALLLFLWAAVAWIQVVSTRHELHRLERSTAASFFSAEMCRFCADREKIP